MKNEIKFFDTQINKNLIFSNEFIDIPEEYREIVIRVNNGAVEYNSLHSSTSPYIGHSSMKWNNTGSIIADGENGLFGVGLNQNYVVLHSLCYVLPRPVLLILEVDNRTFIVGKSMSDKYELQFKRCNILFHGDISEFLNEIPKHTNNIHCEKLLKLKWKKEEISNSYINPLNYICMIADRLKIHTDDQAQYRINLDVFLSDKI